MKTPTPLKALTRTRDAAVRLAYGAMLLGLAALFVVGASVPEGRAQQAVMRIAAIVNDDIISMYDLELRARLAILTGGLNENVLRDRRLLTNAFRFKRRRA